MVYSGQFTPITSSFHFGSPKKNPDMRKLSTHILGLNKQLYYYHGGYIYWLMHHYKMVSASFTVLCSHARLCFIEILFLFPKSSFATSSIVGG